MARRRDRVAALVLAIVFFVTSVGVGLLVVWESVTKDDAANNAQSQQQALAGTRLADFEPTSDVGELKVIDKKEGAGKEVKADSVITVDYTGALSATGIIFESSLDRGQQATLSLDMVIEGWKRGLVGMKEGGERRLVIPAEQAYGDSPPPQSVIPKNAPLVFDITLHSVGAAQTQQ